MLNKILIKKSDSQIRCKKNAQLHVEEKKEKETTSHNTVLTSTPLQNPPHKPKRSGVCVSTTVR
jgi:hypothetical protein